MFFEERQIIKMNRASLTNTFLKSLLLGLAFLLLFLNYRVNVLQLVEKNWFLNWELNSEALVTYKLNQSLQNGIWSNYGFLGNIYNKQIGLQGILFSALNLFLGLSDSRVFISLFHSLDVLFLCILLFIYLYWVKKEFGLYTAVLSYFLLLVNNWFIVTAQNMYWVIFTLILPFISVLLYHSNEEKGRRILSEKQLCVITFVTIAFKSACGYEFISAVMVSAEIPIIYYAIKNRWSWRKSVLRFLKNGLAAIAGFLFALCIHLVQCFLYYGNITSAFQMLQYTIAKRTGFGNLEVEEIYWNSLDASKLSVIVTYLFKGRPVIWLMPMGILLCIYIGAVLFCFIDKKYCSTIHNNRQKYLGLAASFLLSLSAPLSWYVLASAHSYIHVTINYLLWSLPCILLGNVLFFSISIALFKDHWNKDYLTVKIVFLAGLVLTIGFFYMDSCSKGISYIKNCRESGTLLISEGTTDLYYYRYKIYVVADRNQSNDRYFYHIYPKSPSDIEISSPSFDNCDFYFKDHELKTPFWYDTKIAELTFKKSYLPEKLEIGQFNKDKQIWKATIPLSKKLESPDSIIANNVSDSNWKAGIMINGTRILTEFRPEYALLPGKYVEDIMGLKILITDVEVHSPYLHIVLEKPINFTNGYPYKLKIYDN